MRHASAFPVVRVPTRDLVRRKARAGCSETTGTVANPWAPRMNTTWVTPAFPICSSRDVLLRPIGEKFILLERKKMCFPLHQQRSINWCCDTKKRDWTRKLDADRLNQLARRGGSDKTQPPIETYRAGTEPVPFKIPGTLEGTLAQPGAVHRANPHSIAIVELPARVVNVVPI